MSDAASRERLDRLSAVIARLVEQYFPELAHGEPIEVAIGRRARRRLACVSRGLAGPRISVNPLLLLPGAPSDVLEMTVAHELCHIVHGFGRGNRPRGLMPHRGGIVDAEMDRRGMHARRVSADEWCRLHWNDWYAAHASDLAAQRAAKARQREEAWNAFLARPGMRSEMDLQGLADLAAARSQRACLTGVRWLHASRRETRLSYRTRKERVVLIHGVLAHPSVPECVILHELAYWLASSRSPHYDRSLILNALLTSDDMKKVQRWQRRWPRFVLRHSPV